MADNKSCEGKITTLECMECGYREVFSERQFKTTDGLRCIVCDGLVQPAVTRPGEKLRNRKMSSGKDLTVKIDFSQSIKDLKALQREAKKTTAALKELEKQKKDKYLVIELDELGDIPRVYYKGREITLKEFVNFQWTTRSEVYGSTDVIIDYFEKPSTENVIVEKKSIREGVMK